MNADYCSIAELVEQVNEWCKRHRIQPLHNGAGEQVTVRNIRYYQSLGLVDRPLNANGRGFTEKHRLQLIAVRLLQAKGLPLSKIQSLLYGRGEEELREIEARGTKELNLSAALPLRDGSGDWKITPINENMLLLTRSSGEITPAQRLKIQEILRAEPALVPELDKLDTMELESFRPETD